LDKAKNSAFIYFFEYLLSKPFSIYMQNNNNNTNNKPNPFANVKIRNLTSRPSKEEPVLPGLASKQTGKRLASSVAGISESSNSTSEPKRSKWTQQQRKPANLKSNFVSKSGPELQYEGLYSYLKSELAMMKNWNEEIIYKCHYLLQQYNQSYDPNYSNFNV